MSRKIVGVTVGTPTSPYIIKDKLKLATEEWVQEGYQPKGDYLTEHQDISGKLDASELPGAIDTALAQAKASGEFDGKDGYTPVKGVDYFTPDDTAGIVQDVLGQLPGGLISTASGHPIVLNDSVEQKPLELLHLYGKTIQNGTPSPAAPVSLESVGDDGNVTVMAAGKNLFNPALLSQEAGYNTFDESTGLCTTSSFGGWQRSVIYNVAGSGARDTGRIIPVPENTVITIRMSDFVNNTGISESFRAMFLTASGKRISDSDSSRNNTLTVTTPPGTRYIDILRTLDSGTLSFSKIQVEIGSAATEYEPYKELQSATFDTPNGLPGIPVPSGGNYTDEHGQMRACDEIDGARGVRVQRAWEYIVTGNEAWYYSTLQKFESLGAYRYDLNLASMLPAGRTQILCTHYPYAGENECDKTSKCGSWASPYTSYLRLRIIGEYATVDELKAFLAAQYAAGTPVTVRYVLATPIETPLSAEEIAQYAALHTNYPNTTIFNDAGAGMEVKYAADTKLYIDKKFTELAAALVNN